ncbi:lactoylglutathione lyase [Rhinocladiella mackenziei CBS 650.93]|uniref:Lactoylglutathione lyase n=1 Tax=Rhinocladiella mackenziei CBS 650.93 TaxID=1442369 RepID=A0A0D2IJN6_9EURO|nr:lactoylglutathione lyase [Rhinocladiella mackenziei CBS 650.93]KIX03461.1 lactoylglutathione lyase [Rhinocladiella mackenziei CBS 650.93]
MASQISTSSPSPFPHGVFLPNGLNTDPPLPANDPTIGYKLNHFMLRIRDPEKSLHFYINLMGMRTVFTMNVGPFTIYYLGYPHTPEHRADLKSFGLDTSINLQHTLGLLELYHVHGSEKQGEGYYQTGNSPPNLGFGHLGFTVPSVPEALKRLEDNKVEVIKPQGVSTRDSIPISEWENERGVGVEVKGTESEIHHEYRKAFDQIAFVRDPDGYIVELVPQAVDPLDP